MKALYQRMRASVIRRKRMSSVIVYGFASVLPQVVTGILAILYARIFVPGEFGNYSVIIATFYLLTVLIDFGMPSAILRHYFSEKSQTPTYLSSQVYGARLIMLAALPFIGIALYFAWNKLGVRFQQTWLFVPALLAMAFFYQCTEISASLCRAIERPGYFAAGKIVQGGVTFVASIVLVFLFRLNIGGALLGMLAGSFCSFLIYEIILVRALGIRPYRVDWTVVHECLRFGMPLVPNILAAWGRSQALRPALAQVVSMSAVGLFSFASSIAALPSIFSVALELALMPIYFKQRHGDDSAEFGTKMHNFTAAMLAVLFPFWVFAILFCSYGIRLVTVSFTISYEQAGPVCAVLLCASFVRIQAAFFVRQIHFLKQTWVLPAITVPATVLTIGLVAILAKNFGILAAGWATLGMEFVVVAGLVVMISRYERVDYPYLPSLLFLGVLCALTLWVGWNHDSGMGWSEVVLRLAIVALSAAGAFAFWIQPHWTMIRRLSRG